MANFQEGYLKYCKKKGAAEGLRPLLLEVYNQIHAQPPNLHLLKESLSDLMNFLIQPANRSDDNCRAVDTFFALKDHWNTRWEHLPKEYQLVLDDIGGILHDAVAATQIAENFQSTPEQLLERIKELPEGKEGINT